ncbi:MAG: hypothetical protein RBT71_06145 [Flavobacteriales bacterium]|jgi:hypothetical protein|nr:hypothetical protein [Flavobacteriales bacterium]
MRLAHRLVIGLCLPALPVAAQIGRTELRTDTGTVVLHRFSTGEMSTLQWTDRDGRRGLARAFKPDGTVVFEVPTRRIAGHATVRFSYHPNGAVSRAEYSEAPDAGIQWYKSTTTFNEDGNRTGFTEQGRDNHGPLPRLQAPAPPPREPSIGTTDVVHCQRLFANELFVVNPGRFPVQVVATPRHPAPALPGGTFTLAPGDTVRIGTYSMGEVFPPWPEHVTIDIRRAKRNGTGNKVARTRTDAVRRGAEHRALYVVVTGWRKPAGSERVRRSRWPW